MGSEQSAVGTKAKSRKRWATSLWLLFLALLLPGSYGLNAQKDDADNPEYGFSSVGFVYKDTFHSLREIDFENFTFHDFDGKGQPWRTFQLKAGSYERTEDFSSESCWLRRVHLLGSDSDGVERAVALFGALFIGGSSSNTDYVQVLELSKGKLSVAYQISFDTDGLRGEKESWSSRYDPAKKTLTIRSSHYMPGDAHCCISAIDVVTFRWTGREFVRQSVKTELSVYGKKKAEEAKAKKKP